MCVSGPARADHEARATEPSFTYSSTRSTYSSVVSLLRSPAFWPGVTPEGRELAADVSLRSTCFLVLRCRASRPGVEPGTRERPKELHSRLKCSLSGPPLRSLVLRPGVGVDGGGVSRKCCAHLSTSLTSCFVLLTPAFRPEAELVTRDRSADVPSALPLLQSPAFRPGEEPAVRERGADCGMMGVRTLLAVARALLGCQGCWLLMCVLLDCIYLSCIYRASPVPLHLPLDNRTSLNASSSHSPSMPLSPSASHIAAASPSATVPTPSSSSSSLSSSSSSSSSSLNKVEEDSSAENSSVSVPGLPRAELQSRDNSSGLDRSAAGRGTSQQQHHHKQDSGKRLVVAPPHKVRKEFPMALVVASATAAVSILLFFCLSYVWHTRQLDRRAQKLAIRLAAQAEEDLNCSHCRSRPRYHPGSSQDSGSESGGEDCHVLPAPGPRLDELNSLNEEDEDEVDGEDGSRRKPGGVGRTLGNRRGSRGRGGRRSGSKSSRKWSGHSSGQTRSSLVTDQEILSHFASRRHSTFFI